jgi:hypothetical protein
MDLINGTVATAIVGGVIIVAFLLGPRLVPGSLGEKTSLRATLGIRRQESAELNAFASGGAVVLAGLIMAVIYSLLTLRIAI